jgi:hypothetical protein
MMEVDAVIERLVRAMDAETLSSVGR